MKKGHALTLTATAVLGLSLTVLTSVSAARDAKGAFVCGNPRVVPVGKIYGANRGTTYCNDGAKMMVLIAGKPRLSLVGGVCWRNKTTLMVGIGTFVLNNLKASDPPGLVLSDEKSGPFPDQLQLSRGTYHWTGAVNVKRTGKNTGTFAATATGAKVNGRLTGSFTCRRVLYAPEQ